MAQVILRWLLQRDVVAIPKSVRRDRIAENFDILGLELTGHGDAGHVFDQMLAARTLHEPDATKPPTCVSAGQERKEKLPRLDSNQ